MLLPASVTPNESETGVDVLKTRPLEGGVTTGSLTVRMRTAEPVPAALVAVIVMLDVPVAVGVPVIAPVEVFTVRPEGSSVAPKLVGLLLAAI